MLTMNQFFFLVTEILLSVVQHTHILFCTHFIVVFFFLNVLPLSEKRFTPIVRFL